MTRLYTVEDIHKLKPCTNPTNYVPEGWSGTLVDILGLPNVPHGDKLWVVTKLLDDKTTRLFAVWCARQALALQINPDIRSIEACNVSERFALGLASEEELRSAHSAAHSAAYYAREYTHTASDSAHTAAYAAAYSAAPLAAHSAAYAAHLAVCSAQSAQLEKLKEMVGEI